MASNRANLDSTPSNTIYVVLGILLITMSVLGWFLFQGLRSDNPKIADSSDINPSPTPTVFVEDLQPTTGSPLATGPEQDINPAPTEVSTSVNTPSDSAPTPTPIPPTAAPTPTFLALQSEGFSLDYPSYRKLYETSQSYGRRFTLYSPKGNITIHTGTSWSWSHPSRQFTDVLQISGQPTFVYEASNQTIIDLQVSDRKYTIQCVHNNLDSIKSECQGIMSSFVLK